MTFGIFGRSPDFSLENCSLAGNFALTSARFAVLVLKTHYQTNLNSDF